MTEHDTIKNYQFYKKAEAKIMKQIELMKWRIERLESAIQEIGWEDGRTQEALLDVNGMYCQLEFAFADALKLKEQNGC